MINGERAAYLADYLEGFADANSKNDRINGNLKQTSDFLRSMAPRLCGQGFICAGGKHCNSDHK
jgi:hypothetical protein